MSKINIQDQLLYQARRERTPIKIFLLRGLQLVGRISAYDMYSVLLESQGRLQLIFKHAISTIEFPEKIRINAQDGDHGGPGGPRREGPGGHDRGDSRDRGPRDPRDRAAQGGPASTAPGGPAPEAADDDGDPGPDSQED